MKRFKKIYIEITNICNLSCSFCKDNKKTKKYMSKEEFEYILKEIKPYTDYIYLHVKGEPLIHPDLDSILSLCDKNQIKVNITTNGTLLKDKYEILNIHKCIRQINVSLHSFCGKENYFEDVFSICDKLSKEKYISYRSWILNNNKISTIIVDKIKKHYNLSTEMVDKIYNEKEIKIANNTYFSKDYEFIWPSIDNNYYSEFGYCYGLKSHIGILVNGDVIPCCLDDEAVINLGNIFTNTLSNILVKEKTKKMEENFKNRKCSEELCKHCSFKERFEKVK